MTHLASVIVIGLIWFVLIAIILWFLCCRKNRKVSKAVKHAKKPINTNLKIEGKEETKDEEGSERKQKSFNLPSVPKINLKKSK